MLMGAQALQAAETSKLLRPFKVSPSPVTQPPQDHAFEDDQGRPHRLESLRGRIVLVNFWAIWCRPCVAELPALLALRESLKDQPFTLLFVNVLDTPEKVRDFERSYQFTLGSWYDRNGTIYPGFGVTGFPTSLILSPEGQIVGRVLGAREWNSTESLTYFRSLAREIHSSRKP